MRDLVWRENDQPDWNACIAWRRMLIGTLLVSWDITEVLDKFIEQVRSKHLPEAAETRLKRAKNYMGSQAYYEACLNALEALALREGIECVGKTDDFRISRHLCGCFRTVFPTAPPGFERVGRSGNKKWSAL